MKTVIEMAREAGFETMLRKGRICGFDRDGDYTEEIEAFAELVRADEREACVKRAEVAMLGANRELTLRLIKAIQARGRDAA